MEHRCGKGDSIAWFFVYLIMPFAIVIGVNLQAPAGESLDGISLVRQENHQRNDPFVLVIAGGVCVSVRPIMLAGLVL